MTTRNTTYEIALEMRRYGGSFIRDLANAMLNADEENRMKIYATWPDVIQRYDALATVAKKEQPRLAEVDQ